jgi:trehalose 6-phosphate phosphatase
MCRAIAMPKCELLRGAALVEAARALLAEPAAALLSDLDGTLAAIAPRPELAVVRPGVRRALRRLVPRLALVAVVSGRGAADARRLLRVGGVVYVGTHGLEAVVGRRRWMHPEAARYRPVLEAVLGALAERLAGAPVRFELKGVGASVHYRGALDPAAARAAILATLRELPAAQSLVVTEGRQVVELRPPVAASKGTAVACLLRRSAVRAVLFLGDDRTDLDAMRALRAARDAEGLRALVVAVESTEMPPELLSLANGAVRDTGEVESLLTALATP